MKKILFSIFALAAVVTLSSCRNEAEKTEEVTITEETTITPVIEETKEMALETTIEVADSTKTIVEKVEE
tara:strand:- start:3590 stop:3799 length:210 start_codon:yes stop_codon:yes gene_type:complete